MSEDESRWLAGVLLIELVVCLLFLAFLERLGPVDGSYSPGREVSRCAVPSTWEQLCDAPG